PGRGARAVRDRARAGSRPDRAPRRPIRQASGRARHRAEEGGRDPSRARHARGRTRGRALRRRGGGLAPLPANRGDGRLRPTSSARRTNTYLGGGVHLRSRPRARQSRRPASVLGMNDWLSRQAAALGVEGLSESEASTLLELARIAAHESGDRRNAPLLCYLLGRAGGDVEALAEIVRSTS